jgi:hypothetical protein
MRRILLVAALAVAACGGAGPAPSLSDAQKAWCPKHSMTPLESLGGASPYIDDLVIQSAGSLKIQIPNSVARANSTFIVVNATGDQSSLKSVPTTWEADLQAWETTGDYARACVPAYEAANK